MKKVLILALSATMVFSIGGFVYANTTALPNGIIVNQNGTKYLTDSKGEKYSGWFIDSNEDWYYFDETDKTMKAGWYHDEKDGYWYYLSLSDGKMVTGWQVIGGKEYFFQPVRDMGNYHFNNEQEKWLYSMNSKVPYGAMYVNTTTPDGSKVNETGAKTNSAENTVKNGWISNDGRWCYYENGTMAKDKWLNLNGKWYYVTSDGSMVSNSWKDINGKSYYFGSDGTMYVNATTPDGVKVDSNGQKINENVINTKKYIGTYRTELGHAGGGSEEFAITIQKIENNKVWGAFSYGGVTNPGYGEWNGTPIINNKVQGTFYYAQPIWESLNNGQMKAELEAEFYKEDLYLYLDSDSLYFDSKFLTDGKKTKLVSENEYPDDGYREQENRDWLVEGNNK